MQAWLLAHGSWALAGRNQCSEHKYSKAHVVHSAPGTPRCFENMQGPRSHRGGRCGHPRPCRGARAAVATVHVPRGVWPFLCKACLALPGSPPRADTVWGACARVQAERTRLWVCAVWAHACLPSQPRNTYLDVAHEGSWLSKRNKALSGEEQGSMSPPRAQTEDGGGAGLQGEGPGEDRREAGHARREGAAVPSAGLAEAAGVAGANGLVRVHIWGTHWCPREPMSCPGPSPSPWGPGALVSLCTSRALRHQVL